MSKRKGMDRTSRSSKGGSVSQKVSTLKNKKSFQKNYTVPGINTLNLLQVFHSSSLPLTVEEILKLLKLRHNMKKSLQALLTALQKRGDITSLRDGRWVVNKQELTGVFSVQRSGATFVILDQKDVGKIQSDIFIPPSYRNGAWHGDKVSVALNSYAHRGKSFEGRVTCIIERTLKEVVVVFDNHMLGELYLCSSINSRLDLVFAVDISLLESAPQKGDILLITPGVQLKKDMFSGVAKKILGSEKDVSTQERLVKYIHGIPLDFSGAILEEGIALKKAFIDVTQQYTKDISYSEISQISTSARQDLRSISFVTVDGEDARDFDDAICVYEKKDGWELWVAIADVGHFVANASLIDKEALDRANSYYFPTSVSPMLPESLSNEICSLQPGEVRMVMATKICFDRGGIVKNAIFFPGIISSKARLTYKQVHEGLVDKKYLHFSDDIWAMLSNANALTKSLKAFRMDRGSLEFDLPEARFLIEKTTGTLQDITFQEHYISHGIIEECMLAANEAVARFLTEKGIHFLYRIHPKPDNERLDRLFRVLATTHLAEKLPRKPNAEGLRSLIAQAEDTPSSFLINRMILRSMMQAKYSPELEEHFGLASPCYCHFTSPIRRYADLVVHRALKHALGVEGGKELSLQQLEKVADQCNARERVAQDAEREVAKRLGCIFLAGHEGEVFEVVIISITEFGFFVELTSAPIEGVVRLASLKNDWFEYDQDRQELLGVRTGIRFYLGQKIEVILATVSVVNLEIEFKISDDKNTSIKQERKRKFYKKGKTKQKAIGKEKRTKK